MVEAVKRNLVPAGIAAAIALVACALLLVVGAPQRAFARSYDMPKVNIVAEAQADGSLHVVESRTFEFSGDYTAVWWTFDDLPDEASIQVNGVKLALLKKGDSEDGPSAGEDANPDAGNRAGLDAGKDTNADSDSGAGTGAGENEGANSGGLAIDLQSVPFQSSWRDEGGPGTASYSFDGTKDTLYVFFSASDESMVVTVEYTVVDGVQAFQDVAEVYWQYVGAQWAGASSDVSLTLTLPVPSGEEAVPGESVRAWGHGPLDGTVTVNDDGTVSYYVPRVDAGQFAEARVVFPVSWLTDLGAFAGQTHLNELHLDAVLAEEQSSADATNSQRVLSLAFVIACGVACILLLAWALRSYFKHGKEHVPDFTGEYWCNVPDPSVPPAVIGRLWRWGRESPDDFTATIMHLAHRGAVRVDKGGHADSEDKPVDDYRLTRVPAIADATTDPIDRATLDLLFCDIAGGHDALWLGAIQEYGKEHPQEFVAKMADWQGIVSAETSQQNFFEPESKRLQMRMAVAAVAVAVVGIGVFFFAHNFVPLLLMVPTAIALGVIANYMPRRSVRGNNLVARCKALRNWLRDFSSLDERPPTDVGVWGEFMVYAYLFGIADQVIKELRVSVPDLFSDEGSSCASLAPWWIWYASGYGVSGDAMPSASSLVQESVTNTMSVAQAALSGADGSFSSGSGSGGGFSGGGGGGAGGGAR